MLDQLSKGHGIPSICSSHPAVLREAFRTGKHRKVLIETTCNQVNQFGGYSGMTPERFVEYVKKIAVEADFPIEDILLGGDHLGPHLWQNEPSGTAMQKAAEMVRSYVRAGYTKIHLDCSMRLADDPVGALDPRIIAERAARLSKAAEELRTEREENRPQYVIGSEVPVPGGALAHEEGVRVTRVSNAAETIACHEKAFVDSGLEQAWRRVIALVVHPGVEFGDDFVLAYQPDAARELSSFIESQGWVYEAHSTDYQTQKSLSELVRDHFAILKVGPSLTFAYREAIFALAQIEHELIPANERSNIISVLDEVMVQRPEHWQKYYSGSSGEQSFKRKYSLSDRIRYYWGEPEVQHALGLLKKNLSASQLPVSLVEQFAPLEKVVLQQQSSLMTPDDIISVRITRVLNQYWDAC